VQQADVVLALDTLSGEVLVDHRSETAVDARARIGSLIKAFTLLAAFESGAYDPTLEVMCLPRSTPDPQGAGCWNGEGHGSTRAQRAIAHSCNLYFAELAKRLPLIAFRQVLERFFGKPERDSRKPADQMVGLGLAPRYDLRALLAAYTALVNQGTLFTYRDPGDRYPFERRKIEVTPEFAALWKAGLAGSVREGTSRAAAETYGRPTLLGKTGTALLDGTTARDGTELQGLFVGFAPAHRPRFSVLVLVRNDVGSGKPAQLGGELLKLLTRSPSSARAD
jgi:penicillin-binding protein 2